MTTPQESRARFETVVKDETALFGNTDKIMEAYDLATHSLITHAMQQIEAKRKYCHESNFFAFGSDHERCDGCMKAHAHNITVSDTLTILQSLLPEQKKEV